MAEVLFVLLTVYVVYVVQSVIYKKEDKKGETPSPKLKATAKAVSAKEVKVAVEKKPVVKKVAPKKATPAPIKAKAKAKAEKAAPVKAKTKATSKTKAKPGVVSGSLRNPETGDMDKIANSYRMTKRWIKEALVSEGLLPKVYKTTELDDATKLKAKAALDKLAKMDKYQ